MGGMGTASTIEAPAPGGPPARRKRAPRRRTDAPIAEPAWLIVAKAWPGLAAVGALLCSGYAALVEGGFIDRVAHRSELAAIDARVTTMSGDLQDARRYLIDQGRALARIEGKLDAAPRKR